MIESNHNMANPLSELAQDTLKGLCASPKYLLPKYFYDAKGSRIFQDIMNMPEYYLTDCELEIFKYQKEDIVSAFTDAGTDFNLIELGSGDGLKTKVLLKQLLNQSIEFQFMHIDISADANAELVSKLSNELPNLKIEAKTGDYFQLLKELKKESHKRKIIFFLGANIGNYSEDETGEFLNQLADFTNPGDALLIGFDLKKDPGVILQAYDDPHGHTRNFNLNLLKRLNQELDADFIIDNFQHHTTYDPISGDIKSYLISTKQQTVTLGNIQKSIYFNAWEAIFMERSKKYDLNMIESLASKSGFKVSTNFIDSRKYFVDSLWIKESNADVLV